MQASEEMIRQRAYELWDQAGRPNGRSDEFFRPETEFERKARTGERQLGARETRRVESVVMKRPPIGRRGNPPHGYGGGAHELAPRVRSVSDHVAIPPFRPIAVRVAWRFNMREMQMHQREVRSSTRQTAPVCRMKNQRNYGRLARRATVCEPNSDRSPRSAPDITRQSLPTKYEIALARIRALHGDLIYRRSLAFGDNGGHGARDASAVTSIRRQEHPMERRPRLFELIS